MTQIVYDGERFFADRKCYRSSGVVFEQTKLRQCVRDGYIYTWAFSGGYGECEWGDKVIESGFDLDVIEQARRALPNTSEDDTFFGLLVIVPADPSRWNERKAYFVNPFGTKCEVELKDGELMCVGAFQENIHLVWDTVHKIAMTQGSNALTLTDTHSGIALGEWVIRQAVAGTPHDQTGYAIDSIYLKPE